MRLTKILFHFIGVIVNCGMSTVNFNTTLVFLTKTPFTYP